MPISHEIQDRIRFLVGPDYPLCCVPVLVDSAENNTKPNVSLNSNASQVVLLWCGMVDGYKRDALFLIDAMAGLKSPEGLNSLLRIVGPCTEDTRAELLSYARSKNISETRIDIVGFVSDARLWEYCIQAHALLMPLWKDDRSCTRFPTKLGQYVAAGRPIVTARIGETRHFLTDETAMFYPVGDANGLSHSLDRLITEPALGEHLAARASVEVLPRIDFKSNASRISQFFCQIYHGFLNA